MSIELLDQLKNLEGKKGNFFTPTLVMNTMMDPDEHLENKVWFQLKSGNRMFVEKGEYRRATNRRARVPQFTRQEYHREDGEAR